MADGRSQGYISRGLITQQGSRAGAGKDDASCAAVNRKCHPLTVPISTALGHLPALTASWPHAAASGEGQPSLPESRQVPGYQSHPACSNSLPHRYPAAAPQHQGRAVGHEKVCCSFPGRWEEQSRSSSSLPPVLPGKSTLGLNPAAPAQESRFLPTCPAPALRVELHRQSAIISDDRSAFRRTLSIPGSKHMGPAAAAA